ncbi:nucleotidyltransferase domain-containing protein [Candidatus Woesearchaeota archaeon]|nr:nucleotidyltransferase domain-containing protein [Candidatus Woesearchaeota archaeon]
MNFWNKWKKITVYEQERVDLLIKLKKLIKEELCNKVISIFTGGSFCRREYRKNSDLDVWIIVSKDNQITDVEYQLQRFLEEKKLMDIIKQKPTVLSLEALKRGNYLNKTINKMSPRRFTLLSNEYNLLYGKKLPYKALPEMTSEEAFKGMLKWLMSIKDKQFNKEQIAKLYLYTRYFERKYLGEDVSYSFKEMKEISEETNDKLGIICSKYLIGEINDLSDDFKVEIIEEAEKIWKEYFNKQE